MSKAPSPRTRPGHQVRVLFDWISSSLGVCVLGSMLVVTLMGFSFGLERVGMPGWAWVFWSVATTLTAYAVTTSREPKWDLLAAPVGGLGIFVFVGLVTFINPDAATTDDKFRQVVPMLFRAFGWCALLIIPAVAASSAFMRRHGW